MNDLTARQKAILDFLKEHIAATGQAPTRTEIADEFEFASTRGAQKHLEALQAIKLPRNRNLDKRSSRQ